MKYIHFRRLLTILDERHEGWLIPDSIIVFGKKPHIMNARLLSEEEAKKKGYGVENVPIQYRYKLKVDLWLVVFDCVWEGKMREMETDH